MKSIDIIVPCYNEESNVDHFYEEVKKVEKNVKIGSKIPFHFIYVDDGSTDHTLMRIKDLSKKHKEVSFISFSRNFGKEAAICAGLEKSKADYTVLIDIDMQDPPSLLPDMIKNVVKEGYDACGTYRMSRDGEPILRSFFANIFYKLIDMISK
ncbi:MAG: glycosyltransferase family 2 protein, partial [Lachnospiraceae bacterium]|nr:glycosyltransferase family 2 protein [Lachnospiraceae bacterium]